MPNVKSRSLDPPTNNTEKTCNCINSEKCPPLQQKCLTNNIMYKATITSNQDNYQHKIYYGITETKFKQRFANHIKSFRQCFPVMVSLFSKHAYEIIILPSLVASQLTSN